MSAAHVSVHVAEGARLTWHLHVAGTGAPHAWVYVDEEQDVALWGSPPALRRLAAALVVAAEEADGQIAPPADRPVDALPDDESPRKAVVGS